MTGERTELTKEELESLLISFGESHGKMYHPQSVKKGRVILRKLRQMIKEKGTKQWSTCKQEGL